MRKTQLPLELIGMLKAAIRSPALHAEAAPFALSSGRTKTSPISVASSLPEGKHSLVHAVKRLQREGKQSLWQSYVKSQGKCSLDPTRHPTGCPCGSLAKFEAAPIQPTAAGESCSESLVSVFDLVNASAIQPGAVGVSCYAKVTNKQASASSVSTSAGLGESCNAKVTDALGTTPSNAVPGMLGTAPWGAVPRHQSVSTSAGLGKRCMQKSPIIKQQLLQAILVPVLAKLVMLKSISKLRLHLYVLLPVLNLRFSWELGGPIPRVFKLQVLCYDIAEDMHTG